jgi:hypothetical protein
MRMRSGIWPAVVLSSWTLACGGSSNKSTCNNTCATAGATQCSNAQVQTCNADVNGCLAWGAATACASGQACNAATNACDDDCNVAAVASACAAAAVNINQCCGGTYKPDTGAGRCHLEVQKGHDPQVACSAVAAESCDTIHSNQVAAGSTCCCPVGQTCDPENNNACVPTCTTSADCVGNAHGSACVPVIANDVPDQKRFICKPNDGARWHGCNGSVTCPSNDCWLNPATGDNYCLPGCMNDSTCGNPGVACCHTDLTCHNAIESCSTTGGCLFCQ